MSKNTNTYKDKTTIKATNLDKVRWAVERKRSFIHPSMSGVREATGSYIIKSYNQVIAIYSPTMERWYVVQDNYTVTTARHKSLVLQTIYAGGEIFYPL
jgi:hypothetical protein